MIVVRNQKLEIRDSTLTPGYWPLSPWKEDLT